MSTFCSLQCLKEVIFVNFSLTSMSLMRVCQSGRVLRTDFLMLSSWSLLIFERVEEGLTLVPKGGGGGGTTPPGGGGGGRGGAGWMGAIWVIIVLEINIPISIHLFLIILV